MDTSTIATQACHKKINAKRVGQTCITASFLSQRFHMRHYTFGQPV